MNLKSKLSNLLLNQGETNSPNTDIQTQARELFDRVIKTINCEQAFGDENFWHCLHNGVLQGDAILLSITDKDGITRKVAILDNTNQ